MYTEITVSKFIILCVFYCVISGLKSSVYQYVHMQYLYINLIKCTGVLFDLEVGVLATFVARRPSYFDPQICYCIVIFSLHRYILTVNGIPLSNSSF